MGLYNKKLNISKQVSVHQILTKQNKQMVVREKGVGNSLSGELGTYSSSPFASSIPSDDKDILSDLGQILKPFILQVFGVKPLDPESPLAV